MLFAALACTPFPCADSERLDAQGECHATPVAGAADSADTAGDDPADSGDPADTGDTADTAGGWDSGDTADTGTPVVDGWPVRFAAPYVDATGYPTVKVGEIPAETGIDHYTLGFLVAASATECTASWGTYYSLEIGPSAWEGGAEYFLYDQIARLRADGGDVMVSFGGAANTPIEAACGSVEAVVAEYVRVIEALDLTRVDFDIEGAWVAHPESIVRRSEAIVQLQAWAAENGRPLHVWYTLPVLPSGLTTDGLAVVRAAVDAGVNLAGVNVMTMDYGAGEAPNPEGKMGEYGIAAIESLHGQLASVWPELDETEVWARIGTTPMLGQNDVAGEVFDLDDADQTVAFAEAHAVGMIGFWSINRDHPCDTESEWAHSTCSGYVDVPDWAFSQRFAGYGGE